MAQTTITEFQVTGMTCGHCEMSVTEEVTEVQGVTAVKVSAATGKLIVTSENPSENPIDDALIIAAVEEAGYSAVRA